MAVPVRGLPKKNMRMEDRDQESSPGVFVAAMDRALDSTTLSEGFHMTDRNIGLPANSDIAKAQAKRLRSALAPDLTLGHGQALELIARVHGEQSWGRLNSLISGASEVRQIQKAEQQKRLPSNHVGQRVLQGLWKGLKDAKQTHPSGKATSMARELRDQEIIPFVSLEGYLDTIDASLGGMVFDIGADNLVNLAKVETVFGYPLPEEQDARVSGIEGLRPASFAAVLIWLERLGFDTHPETFYGSLLETIRKAKHVSHDELTCLWHLREKKSFETSEYLVDATTEISNVEVRTVEGRNGLTIEIAQGTDTLGLIASLLIYR